jgi:hypothetical protein
MIKRLLGAIVLVLAINFLAMGGAVGFLWKSGALDRDRIQKIKEVLYPTTTTAPASQPDQSADASTQPTDPLTKLMAGIAPRTAQDQVNFLSQSYDSQMAIIDRRQTELAALQQQIEDSRQQVEKERAAVEADRARLTADQAAATQEANDAGFQTCLSLYTAMPAIQVKTLFLQMDDATVGKYLAAMQPRTASKIIREFKAPDEINRIQKILATMSTPAPAPAANAASNGASSGGTNGSAGDGTGNASAAANPQPGGP